MGKEKEYMFGELIYEGDSVDRKRHGEGKEYEDGKIIFQGKYFNGKRE